MLVIKYLLQINQHHLKNEEWESLWLLRFDPKKCKAMHLGGGSGLSILKITILTYGLRVTAWACTNNLRLILGPCVQCCPPI